MSNKLPGITMKVVPFAYIRVHNVALGATWSAYKGDTYGGDIFPSNAIHLRCNAKNGMVEIQDSRDPNTLRTYSFNDGARIAIIGNTFVYFELDLAEPPVDKSLEEILLRKG